VTENRDSRNGHLSRFSLKGSCLFAFFTGNAAYILNSHAGRILSAVHYGIQIQWVYSKRWVPTHDTNTVTYTYLLVGYFTALAVSGLYSVGNYDNERLLKWKRYERKQSCRNQGDISGVCVTNKTGFGFVDRIYRNFIQLATTVHKSLSDIRSSSSDWTAR
jgi:hypothetical protein